MFINNNTKENILEHKPFQINKNKYFFCNLQGLSNSQNNFIQFKFSPQNSYSSTLTVNGGIISFKINNVNNVLIQDIIFSWKLSNSDAANGNTVISAPMQITKLNLKQ